MRSIALTMCLIATFVSPAVGQEEALVGPAKAATVREGGARQKVKIEVVEPANAGDHTADKSFRLHHALLGVEWGGGPYFQTYTYVSYEGNRDRTVFGIDQVRMEIVPQAITIVHPENGWGITPDAFDGQREAFAGAKVARIGTHRLFLDIGRRRWNTLEFEIKPILDPYACYLGAGTGLVLVEFYTNYFDKPPRSESVRMRVGGRDIPARMHLFDEGQGRIDVVITWDEYREIFNPTLERFDWSERLVRVDTDSPLPTIRRLLSFMPGIDLPHC